MTSNKSKVINRAQVVDDNFIAFVKNHQVTSPKTTLAQQGLDPVVLKELFESQLRSRQLDLMARILKLQNKVFYTIGSSGHEGNAMLGRLVRHSDPAFLHYRSAGLMMERSRHVPGTDPIWDTCLSFAAAQSDPASGGRHKVWGSKPLWVIPQTSTIASHLPKAVGCALGIELAQRSKARIPVPDDAIVLCNFGDASANHSTAQGAFNAASWAAFQGLKVPVLFVCEDNGIGISVKTPDDWIKSSFRHRPGMQYFQADGLDLETGYQQVKRAVDFCRQERKPVFLHLRTTRLMGHAGTDFEVDYRKLEELEAAEALDPLLKSAASVMNHGLMSAEEVLDWYQAIHLECMEKAESAHQQTKIQDLDEVMAPLAPQDEQTVYQEAARTVDPEQRVALFGSEKALPERQPAKHMAVQINKGLHDLMLKYPEMILFGEDVAQKGGVYTITKQLFKNFSAKRVFNTLLDEQTILGLAQGYSYMGQLPVPEIQYLAYFHNACDQIRGEAASLQFFSNGQYANPMVVRIAGLGYQKGFGGHFHNDNSIAAIRDIPGVTVACPSRADDAVMMMRTLTALSKVNGRVSLFLEPIALYMHKDLHEEGDGEWNFPYPEPGEYVALGEPRLYHEGGDILIITYGNGVPMSLAAAKMFEDTHQTKVTVMDLRWLQPLNGTAIQSWASQFDRVLVVDEGRRSACLGEGVITLLCDLNNARKKGKLIVDLIAGADSFTPLADAAKMVLPDKQQILEGLIKLNG